MHVFPVHFPRPNNELLGMLSRVDRKCCNQIAILYSFTLFLSVTASGNRNKKYYMSMTKTKPFATLKDNISDDGKEEATEWRLIYRDDNIW